MLAQKIKSNQSLQLHTLAFLDVSFSIHTGELIQHPAAVCQGSIIANNSPRSEPRLIIDKGSGSTTPLPLLGFLKRPPLAACSSSLATIAEVSMAIKSDAETVSQTFVMRSFTYTSVKMSHRWQTAYLLTGLKSLHGWCSL